MADNRLKRHMRIRKKISGNAERMRVAVYRSNMHMQIQLIDDVAQKTIVGLSTAGLETDKLTKTQKSEKLGSEFAKKVLALENGKHKNVVFDRGGYRFHGRVKALAESLRSNGLVF